MIGTQETICPLCLGSMSIVFGTGPQDFMSGVCLECGYCYWTEMGVISLEAVNEVRKEEDPPLEPLKKLKIDLKALDLLRSEHGLAPMEESPEEWRRILKRIKEEVISQDSTEK